MPCAAGDSTAGGAQEAAGSQVNSCAYGSLITPGKQLVHSSQTKTTPKQIG